MAGVLRVERPLLFRLELRPVEHERELHQFRIVVERQEQAVHAGELIVGFKLRRGDVVQDETLADGSDRDLLLLREVALRIETGQQPQIEDLGHRFGERYAAIRGAHRIDSDDVQMLMIAERLPIECHHAILVRREVHEDGTRMGEEVEVGEIAIANDASEAAVGFTLGHARRGRACGSEGVSAGGDLLAGLGRADGPRVQQQRRPVEHVAGELRRVLAVDDVAVLVADVPSGEIDRLGGSLLEQVRLGRADAAQVGIGRVLGQVSRAEDMHAGKLRRVRQLDRHLLVADVDVGDLQRRECGRLQLTPLAGNEAPEFVSLGHSHAEARSGRFEEQIEVSHRQLVDDEHSVLDADEREAIDGKEVAAQFEQ